MAESTKSQDRLAEAGFHFPKQHFYSEMIRIVTGLYVGVLALMTFLLTVGLQKPHNDFKWALYTAIVVLSLNLLAYLGGHMFFIKATEAQKNVAVSDNKEDKEKESDKSTKSTSAAESAHKQLKMMRMIQKILFVLAILAVAWLAIATAQFFFSINPSATGAGGTSTQ
jgi:hypothetical protein